MMTQEMGGTQILQWLIFIVNLTGPAVPWQAWLCGVFGGASGKGLANEGRTLSECDWHHIQAPRLKKKREMREQVECFSAQDYGQGDQLSLSPAVIRSSS